MNPNELYHHGILGMHWGIRRFQPYPKGSGKKGKEIGAAAKKKSVEIVQKYKDKKKAKQRNENLKKAREKAAENRKLAADKDRVLKSGSAREVLRYKGKLTNQELQSAVTRLNLEATLKTMSQKEVKSNMQKIDDAMQNLKKVNEWAKIGTDAYNTIARSYNATARGRRNPMTIIGQPQQTQQRRS